jgi:hypothetical protein
MAPPAIYLKRCRSGGDLHPTRILSLATEVAEPQRGTPALPGKITSKRTYWSASFRRWSGLSAGTSIEPKQEAPISDLYHGFRLKGKTNGATPTIGRGGSRSVAFFSVKCGCSSRVYVAVGGNVGRFTKVPCCCVSTCFLRTEGAAPTELLILPEYFYEATEVAPRRGLPGCRSWGSHSRVLLRVLYGSNSTRYPPFLENCAPHCTRTANKKPLDEASRGRCGDGRNRTADTRIFSPLLYRLSYITMPVGPNWDCKNRRPIFLCKIFPQFLFRNFSA